MEQRTLARSFTLAGAGIHTGASGRLTLHPAEPDAGRVFRLGAVTVPARADYVIDTRRCTTLGREGASISTVEHLLSALYGLSVDNVVIEAEGPEVPILDGSALPFVEAILSAGIVGQNQPLRALKLTETLTLEEGDCLVTATPTDAPAEFRVDVQFADWPEGSGTLVKPVGADFAEEYAATIAPARTFAFRREVEMLLAAGLAKGGSLDNALIVTPPDEFSTPLRLPQEWQAHKLLDMIGDLALTDARLVLNVTATRPGHRINTLFAQALLHWEQTHVK